jgi:hypothetical protein
MEEKMKKIITALANPQLSEKIKENCEIEIISPDIQYQEGVLEILQKTKEAELLILNSIIEGNLNIYEFINKIKEKNKLIEIIIILEKENIELENFLNGKRIFNIFYNNKNTINELIKIINEKNKLKKEEDINEEIKMLKELILKKNNKNEKIINFKNKIIKIIKSKKNTNKIINKRIKENNIKKTISVVGSGGVGKSIFCSIFAKLNKNKKILIIDFDILNSSINSIFGIKINNKKTIKMILII